MTASLLALLPVWAGASLFLVVVMAAAWQMQRQTGQDGWADAFWSLGLGLAGFGVSLWSVDGSPPSARQALAAVLIVLWGLRLGMHIAHRTAREPSDRRYGALREGWGDQAAVKMFGFLMLQAGAASFLLFSVLLAAHSPGTGTGLGVQDLLATSILIIAVVGEGLADRQLARFKATKTPDQSVCDTGLWAWSRHPNYFFEWLAWCAWPLFAIRLDAAWPWGWLALSAPIYIYWLLKRVSGIPLLEAHMRVTRPEAFKAYAARTSAFFPRPPKP